MNEINLHQLANFIEKSDNLPFKMSSTDIATCDTAGCIGGFAGVLWPETQYKETRGSSLRGWDAAAIREKLGLTEHQFRGLCYPGGAGRTDCRFTPPGSHDPVYPKITRPIAVATIRHLAKTGEVLFDLPPNQGPVYDDYENES